MVRRIRKALKRGKNYFPSRHLEDTLKKSFKTSSRCLEDVLEDDKLLRWICIHKKSSRYVLSGSLRLLRDQKMSPGNAMLT